MSLKCCRPPSSRPQGNAMPVLTEVDATKRADEERLQGGSETRDREVEPPPLPTKSDQAQQEGPLETNGEGELTREFKLHRYLAGDHRVGDRAAVVRSPALGMARRNREGMANGEEQNRKGKRKPLCCQR